MNRWTCASRRANFITLQSSSLACCSTALRASSNGLSHQIGTILDQLLGSCGERGTADDKTDVLEKATDMTWFSRSRLMARRQRPARQQRSENRMDVDN
jgi:hypothetical protein